MDRSVCVYSSNKQLKSTLPCMQSKKFLWLKSSNLKRHYESKHSDFERIYKQGTEERKQEINQLKSQHEISAVILANMTTAQEKATECSLGRVSNRTRTGSVNPY